MKNLLHLIFPPTERPDIEELFDSEYYLSQTENQTINPADALEDYLHTGWKNGLRPLPLFDPDWYLHFAEEARETGVEPLTHYVSRGWQQGTSPHPLFDTPWYLSGNPDVQEREMNPLLHYVKYGHLEGRSPHPWFDTPWYRQNYRDDLAHGTEPASHYLRYGWKLGLNPSSSFLGASYLGDNPHFRDSGVPPLIHHIAHESGIDQAPLAHFNAEYYYLMNRDLGLSKEAGLAKHFAMRGRSKGRPGIIPSVAKVKINPDHSQKYFKEEKPCREGKHQGHRPLIIAGFHRSGTSLATNIFHHAGLHVGDDLLGAKESNKYGHFEDREIIAFHDSLLAKAGTTWQTDRAFFPLLDKNDYRWMFEYGVRKSSFTTWGFKDPRVCLFLSEWVKVFEGARVLYIYRPGIECISSLKRRAAKDLYKGIATKVNEKFWTRDDLAVRMYLTYARAALSFLEAHTENTCVVPINEIFSGRDIVSEVNEQWGYRLADAIPADFSDAGIMSSSGQNETVLDPQLIQEIQEVESRFVTLTTKGFSSGIFSGKETRQRGEMGDAAAI